MSVLSDATHDTPQDVMQLQSSMLVHLEAKDQLDYFWQHYEEPLVPKVTVYTFNSHGVRDLFSEEGALGRSRREREPASSLLELCVLGDESVPGTCPARDALRLDRRRLHEYRRHGWTVNLQVKKGMQSRTISCWYSHPASQDPVGWCSVRTDLADRGDGLQHGRDFE